MEVALSCFDVTLWFIYLCLLVDHIGVLEVFRFRYNSHTDNGQIFVMLAEFVLDLSLLWRLELLLNYWRFFNYKESLFSS